MQIIAGLKRFVKRCLYAHRADEDTFLRHLREGGAEIGQRVRIYDPQNTVIDVTRPWMLKIGDDVQITSGVTILTHGYDWSVLKGLYGQVLGSCGEVVIGNNVFIGMHTTILKGVHIGSNCVIGANSLVNHDIDDGWVAAGNPARPIMRIEDYYEKRLDAQLQEAQQLYDCYRQRMHTEPPAEVFDEFFWLFLPRDCETVPGWCRKKMELVGNFDESLALFRNSKARFDGYESFLYAMRCNSTAEKNS